MLTNNGTIALGIKTSRHGLATLRFARLYLSVIRSIRCEWWTRFLKLFGSSDFFWSALRFGSLSITRLAAVPGGYLVGAYAFGFAVLFGCFGIFPGGTRVKNEWGDRIRVGSIFNLSKLQIVSFLSWTVGFGGVLAYLSVAYPNL